MPLESDALLASLLATDQAADCHIAPDASPAGAIIRVLFTGPFFGQDATTGQFANTRPQAHARASDVASIVPEVTVLEIEGQRYTAKKLEKVEGGNAWRLLVLNEV